MFFYLEFTVVKFVFVLIKIKILCFSTPPPLSNFFTLFRNFKVLKQRVRPRSSSSGGSAFPPAPENIGVPFASGRRGRKRGMVDGTSPKHGKEVGEDGRPSLAGRRRLLTRSTILPRGTTTISPTPPPLLLWFVLSLIMLRLLVEMLLLLLMWRTNGLVVVLTVRIHLSFRSLFLVLVQLQPAAYFGYLRDF
jgi:hypothetical protein